MYLVLTMAGRYSRFVNEGYKLPKYLLPWGNKTILEEILTQLLKDGIFSNVLIVANKRDDIYMPHVRAVLKSLGLSPEQSMLMVSDTKGQAETAFLGVQHINSIERTTDSPIIFHNIDTILYNRSMKQALQALKINDGYIDVFKSSSHAYSYVLTENDQVVDLAEKVVISNQATSGLYGFSSTESFLNHYNPEDDYISEVYQKMLSEGKSIEISNLHSEQDTIVLGTPTEYLTSAYLLDVNYQG